MDVISILVLSILLQLTAGFLALRLVWVTGKSPAWALLAAGISLMALRRCITLYQLVFWEVPTPLDLTAELVALAISALMVVGIAWIAPLFRSLQNTTAALRLNESRLEALWQLSRMTEASLQQIADFTLEEGVRLTRSQVGYLGFMDEHETVLTIRSWSKNVMEQCRIKDKPMDFPLENAGLWGEAVRQRQPVITNDYQAANPCKKGCPEGHLVIKRHLNLPVFDRGRIVAVAGVGNKAEPYDDTDIRQLTLLLNGMWRLIQRKQTEAALTAEIERMHQFQAQLIETSSDGIIANDRQARIIIFNEGAERILGYRKEEVIGQISVDHLYRPGVARQIKKLLYSPEYGGVGHLVNYETSVVSRTGQDIPVELSATIIYDEDREVGVVGFFRDLRVRKQLEAEVLQAGQLAALGRMAAHISHEIKNPLMLIGGFARQVLKGLDQGPEKSREKLQIIVDEIGRLEDFLVEVGSYAKLSEPRKQPGDLNALIQEVCDRLAPVLQESGITLSLKLDPDLPRMRFDPVYLRQVFLNIAKNAVEAMPHGGDLTITSGLREGRLLVRIADTGKGIPPEHLDKIFQPFFSTKSKGTGLGLAISRKITEAHQGEITIDSQSGRGTRVNIFLGLDS
jgi:PAS domain S-box-containing protein